VANIFNACRTWGIWRKFHKNIVPQSADDVDIVFNICANRSQGRAVTVNQLVANCVASRNTVLRHLRALIERGIVSMKRPASDGRIRELGLTRKGISLVHKAANSLKQLGAAIRAGGKHKAL